MRKLPSIQLSIRQGIQETIPNAIERSEYERQCGSANGGCATCTCKMTLGVQTLENTSNDTIFKYNDQNLLDDYDMSAGRLLKLTLILFGLPLFVLIAVIVGMDFLGVESAATGLLIVSVSVALCFVVVARTGDALEKECRVVKPA